MRIVLLLIAVLVPSYLLMCQRQTGEDAGAPGEVIYQRPLEQARGVEQQLRDDLNRRGADIQRQAEGVPDPEGG
ncbi:MAG: hypothetical protein ACOY42_08025 [Pseudomonadota bacterium]|jgi:hypothetical protein